MIKQVARAGFELGVLMLIALVLGGCTSSDPEISSGDVAQDYSWKLVTAWPPNLPVTHDVVVQFAKDVEVMSRGQMKIQVYAGGELIPALEVFDAVSNGSTVQMGHAAAYYWAGKIPAAQFMSAVPFGLTARGMNAWLHGGDGLQLWRDLYAPFDLVPFPMGNTGTQMGGWFNKRVESAADLDGLKMRIPGLGGKVFAKAGGNPILLSGGEVYTALERGNIDATEWVGPLHDLRFGLDSAAKYYYYPGWHEPSTQLELVVNKQAWNSLPPHLKRIIETAATAAGVVLHARMEAENARVFAELRASGKTEVVAFPTAVLARLYESAALAFDEEADKDPQFRTVRENYEMFRQQFSAWDDVTEDAYRAFLNQISAD